jgi:hypothetical protein
MPPLCHGEEPGCFLCGCLSIAGLDVFVPAGVPPYEPVLVSLCDDCFGKSAAIEAKIQTQWEERMRPGLSWWLIGTRDARGPDFYCLSDALERPWLCAFTSEDKVLAFVEPHFTGELVLIMEQPADEFLLIAEALVGQGLEGIVRDPQHRTDGTMPGYAMHGARFVGNIKALRAAGRLREPLSEEDSIDVPEV